MSDSRMIEILVRHEHLLNELSENTVRKQNLDSFKDQVLSAFDDVMVILKKLDQEITIINYRIDKLTLEAEML